MPSDTPFVDPDTGRLDTNEIVYEAVPVAKLLGLFVAVAIVPLAVMVLLGPTGPLGALIGLLAQFVLAVGGAIVLMYVIVRAQQLAAGGTPSEPDT